MLKHDDYIVLLLPLAMLGLLLSVMEPQKAGAVPGPGAHSAIVFMYQRIGEEEASNASISLDRFAEHVEELKNGGYHVVPLADVVDAMKPEAKPLPEKSVAVTIDGAYAPTLSAARDLLGKAGFPFTVFFAADQADSGEGHLTWEQLKALKKDPGVTFGILPAAYTHMTESGAGAAAALFNRAVSKYRENFGEDPQFFAWPYGEHSAALKKQVAAYGFRAVFGQQSGVVHPGSDPLALPRFTMTGEFANLDRFRLTATALPLPVTDVVPDDMMVADPATPPLIGFTVAPEISTLSRLSCFASGLGKLPLTRPTKNRVEIRLTEPLQDRRTRINCTLPDGMNWRWFGLLLLSPGIADDEAGAADPQSPAEGTE